MNENIKHIIQPYAQSIEKALPDWFKKLYKYEIDDMYFEVSSNGTFRCNLCDLICIVDNEKYLFIKSAKFEVFFTKTIRNYSIHVK